MALPKQVQAQLDEVEELEKALEAQNIPPEPAEEATEEEQLETEAEVTSETEASTRT